MELHINYGLNLIMDYAEYEPEFVPKHGLCGYEAVAQIINPQTTDAIKTMEQWAEDNKDKKTSQIVAAQKPLKTNQL